MKVSSQSPRRTKRTSSPLFLLLLLLATTASYLLEGSCSSNSILPLVSAANQLGERESELPLFATSVVHCDEMIYLHRWEGDCCSLNVTEGNGCILNVMNGYCKVYGQEWTLEYTSTYDAKDCPPSEYTPEMLGMKVDNNKADESSSSLFTPWVWGNMTAAGFFFLSVPMAMALALFG